MTHSKAGLLSAVSLATIAWYLGQAAKGMYVGPVRRRLGADDAFFEAGNVQRALLCKLSVFRQEEEEDSTAMMSAFEDDQPRYECMFQDCGAKFSSLKRVRVGVSFALSVVPIFHSLCHSGRKFKDH